MRAGTPTLPSARRGSFRIGATSSPGMCCNLDVSIRWKLFFTLFLLTAGSIAVVLVVAEREFHGWVRAELTQRFEAQLAGLLKSRTERLAQLCETCTELSATPEVRAVLTDRDARGGREAIIKMFRDARAALPERTGRPHAGGARPTAPQAAADNRPRNGARPDRSALPAVKRLPVMGVLDLEGNARHFGRRIRQSTTPRAVVAESMSRLARRPTQETAYVVVTGEEDQRSHVQEVVVTPVRDEHGTVLGWFFLGHDAETQIERAFYQAEESSGSNTRSGLVAENQWFVNGVSAAKAEAISARLGEAFWTEGRPERVEIDGRNFIVIARDLNPDSPLGKGYQVALFPINSIIESLDHLHVIVGIVGGVAVLTTALVAFLLARRFSRPIAELVAGTERIRLGKLGEDVRVRSKDEFGTLAGAFNAMTRDLALKERYREVLGKVSDPSVAQQLVEGELELGGEVRTAAVLFCDIRGFTAMTEGMPPAEVIEFVNEHMTAMTQLVYLHGGVVDKFVGDLIMAVFGVPTSQGDDALPAARCALEMLAERSRLNEKTGRPVEVGIGLAYGELVAGCMGSVDRLNYTVLGDRVNLAARLCSAAGPGEVLSDRAITDALDDTIHAEPREPIRLKGFSEAMDSFALSRG